MGGRNQVEGETPNPAPMISRFSLLPRGRRVCRLLLSAALAFGPVFVVQGQSPAGSEARGAAPGGFAGTVGNQQTSRMLEGARVEIPSLGRVILTARDGSFSAPDLPAGTHEVVVTYTGLDAVRKEVTIVAGQVTVERFEMTSDVYQLPEFQVAGEREGNALALTLQRNAPNVKNVVALDAFGNLPNMSAGELAIRLPGVAGQLDDEGNVTGVIVRGQPSTSNRITVDGGLLANQGGMNRQFQTQNFTAAMFEQVELIKGHTPDQSADSLGGTVNLKTRSPLALSERRQTAYSFAARWAAPLFDHIPMREAHRIHPLINVTHQEVFDVAGGERNLGIALNAFYSENANGYHRTLLDWQNTDGRPAYVWDYRVTDGYNNRQSYNFGMKVEYQASPSTKISLNTIYNDVRERRNPIYEVRAFTGDSNTVPSDTSGIIPGYSEQVTEVRPVAGSAIEVSETIWSAFNRARGAEILVEQEFGRLQLDYLAGYNQNHLNLGNSGAGNFSMRLAGVGWLLDRSHSDAFPTFVQTAGLDWSDPNNYRPTGFLVARNNHRDVEIKTVRANARYELPTEVPLELKSGFEWREQFAEERYPQRRWSYAGTGPLSADADLIRYSSLKNGIDIPAWESESFMEGGVPKDLSLWTEDLYYREQQKYVGFRGVTEAVTSGYAMGTAKFGNLGILSGVRVERTETDSYGWVRAHSGSTPAEQQADPVGAAQRDYANTYRRLKGSYTKAFPGAHLTYDITPDLKARASWSNSFGRPPLSSLTPNESFKDANQTVTVSNPSLLPQMSENWDLTLDYYFEPVGTFSVGWFQKTIDDYIINGIEQGVIGTGPDNGFNGEYAGYRLLTSDNGGSATVRGWEFAYSQQLTFLPGALRGLGVTLNYTKIETEGDFGGNASLTTNEVAGFIPETANANLTWRYGRFGSYLRINYTSDYINSYSAASVARNEYRDDRLTTDVGVSWRFRPWLTFFCDVSNIENEPIRFYRGIESRLSRINYTGTTMTVGVNGRF